MNRSSLHRGKIVLTLVATALLLSACHNHYRHYGAPHVTYHGYGAPYHAYKQKHRHKHYHHRHGY